MQLGLTRGNSKKESLAIKGEVGEVSELQLMLKKEVEEAPFMDDG